MTFKEFAVDTAYRCGWTFAQAFLSCMTFGQSILNTDWKGAFVIACGAVVYVLVKQMGVWCKDHIKDPSDLQTTFNEDNIGMFDYEEEVTDDEDTADMSE